MTPIAELRQGNHLRDKLAKAQEILEHVQLADNVYWGLETNLKEFML